MRKLKIDPKKLDFTHNTSYSDFRRLAIAEKKRRNRERILDMIAGVGLGFLVYIVMVVFLSL